MEYTSVSNTRMFTSSPEASTWSRPPKPISYAQPSPPKIHCERLARYCFSSKIAVIALVGLATFSRSATKRADRSRVPAPCSRCSFQSVRATLSSACSSVHSPIAVVTYSPICSRIFVVPTRIPYPNSALSSKSEFAQVGPWPA